MRSYTPDLFYKAQPVGFTGGTVTLENTLLDPKSNVVIQTAILQRAPHDVSDERLPLSAWEVVTAVRGNGRAQGYISTPTKGVPNVTGWGLAKEAGLLDVRWAGNDLDMSLQGTREDFYASSAVDIVSDAYEKDGWHFGPDNSDLLTNEVTHLLLAKFGQKLGDQMTQNLGKGKRSFICKQVNWVGGYSVDWVDADNVANASVEPNIMIGVIVIVDQTLDLSGNTLIYSSFGLTPLDKYREAMSMPAEESGKILAPYSNEAILHRSYTSMCMEVTNKTAQTIETDTNFQKMIEDGYKDLLV